VIETLPASPQAAQEIEHRALRAHSSDLSIVLSVPVQADARRISQALTMPEYLEAWMSMPNQQKESAVVAASHDNGYRVDHFLSGRVVASLTGSFLFCHQRKMRLLWRTVRSADSSESVVDFRVRGNFASSVLELRHTAFASVHDFLWHKQLWYVSLDKLTALLCTGTAY